ncbi:AAA family ATPase [Sorangium sp. So ce315]|uniref:AAA family ATPase n=1 Tax=Sorangium sp. So ce315 TaxID=3133299 RepID=UPI003F5E13FD
MARFFNTAGPCRPDLHYMVDPLRRIERLRRLIDRQSYFVVHGPRQTGKTTSLLSLAAALDHEGRYAAALLSLEVGRAFPEDVGAAEAAILQSFRDDAAFQLPPYLRPPSWPDGPPGHRLAAALAAWAQACPRPLVLFLDEIDALTGPTLLSALSQLRGGHRRRPQGFPWAIALIGMRDVRDYKVTAGEDGQLGSASPFNVKEESVLLRDFTRDEVAGLYAQHTADTGQVFSPKAVDLAFQLTGGQPWLVNALAREMVDELVPDRGVTLLPAHVRAARDAIVLRQDTHLDSLAERLQEDRVRAVLEPILAGSALGAVPEDDQRYVMDLGLVRQADGGALEIANPIYGEILPRVLSATARRSMPAIAPTWLRRDGRLDPERLLEAFVAFWRQHAEALLASTPYAEVAPHLVLMAFLHRVVNGRGRVEREVAIGSGRMDLLVEYGQDRLAMELKVWRPGEPDPKREGLAQLDGYLEGLGLDRGWLLIFDRRPGIARLRDRTTTEAARTPDGREVTVIRA